MMLDQKILIEFTGEQAREFLTILRECKRLLLYVEHSNKPELTAEEAALFTGKPKSFIYSLAKKNLIKKTRHSGRLYFNRLSIENYLNNKTS